MKPTETAKAIAACAWKATVVCEGGAVVGAGRIGRAKADELGDEVAAEVVMAEG
jgi:hypothetical protein